MSQMVFTDDKTQVGIKAGAAPGKSVNKWQIMPS
jgi:hypothetical protein